MVSGVLAQKLCPSRLGGFNASLRFPETYTNTELELTGICEDQ